MADDMYRTWKVQSTGRAPLVSFMEKALVSVGCTLIQRPRSNEAPFRFSFVTPWGERVGVIAYAFLANSRSTTNRPPDEHRFQLKYGSKDGRLHELWQDPFGLYTTLLVGINPTRGFFVGADPVLNSPTRLFVSKEFKEEHAQIIEREGWHAWERSQRAKKHVEESEAVETLVGGTADQFLKYILFEREARGEDQGHRHFLADHFGQASLASASNALFAMSDLPLLSRARLHALEGEFALPAKEILDIIAQGARVKMAVRGAIAERHLHDALMALPDVAQAEHLTGEGQPDFRVRMTGSRRDVFVECKNVLRTTDRYGHAKLDFQRTRAPKRDPCGRYYGPSDFNVLAACLHAHTERWEFAARLTSGMAQHRTCPGKINNNVVIDDLWARDLSHVLRLAIA